MRGTSKLGWLLLIGCFIGAGIEGNRARKAGAEDPEGTLFLGQSFELEMPAQGRAAKGYHRWLSLQGELRAEGGETVPVEVRGVHERRWPGMLDLEPASPSSEGLTEEVLPWAKVSVPARLSLEGKAGTLHVQGILESVSVRVDEEKGEFRTEPVTRDVVFDKTVRIRDGAGQSAPKSGEKSLSPLQAGFVGGFLLGAGLLCASLIGAKMLILCLFLIFTPIAVMETFFDGVKSERAVENRPELQAGKRSFAVDVDQASVSGYCQLTSLSAWLKGFEDHQIEVPVRSISNKPWPNQIEVQSVRVGPVFKTNRTGIDGRVELDLPANPSWAGRTGTLLISGAVDFPDIGAVDALNPILTKFGIASKRWDFRRQVRFPGSDEDPAAESDGAMPTWALTLPMGLGILLFLGSLAAGLFRKFSGAR
ncbi:MAG: hypothetical protein R3F17_01665 [Planctomycetota bacterium]